MFKLRPIFLIVKERRNIYLITTIDEAVKIGPIRLDILKKFEMRSETLSKPSNPLVKIDTACSLCSGPGEQGYKIFNASDVKLGYNISSKSHIVSHLLYVGPRNGKQVQHLCGVRFCSNPTHLCLGNAKQNGQHASKTKAISDHSKKSWKLSEPDKERIRRDYWVHNNTITELAEMYEVHVSTIRRIIMI